MQTETPVGFRFCPTPKEIIIHYLLNKAQGTPLPADVMIECDIYGEKAEWMKEFEERKADSLYFFTQLRKKSYDKSKKNTERVSGCGTWKESQKDRKICMGETHIGSKKSFKFLSKQGGLRGRWLMDEYRLDGCLLDRAKHNAYVVCHIKHLKELRARAAEDFDQEDKSDANTNLSLQPELAISSEYVEPPSMNTTSWEPDEVISLSMEDVLNLWNTAEELDELLSSPKESLHPSPETIKSSVGTINTGETSVRVEVQMVDSMLVSPPPSSTVFMPSESNALQAGDELFYYQQQPLQVNDKFQLGSHHKDN